MKEELIKIENAELQFMCKFQTAFLSPREKEICEKYKEDKIVTDELLKVYCIMDLEICGDLYNECDVRYVYKDKYIIGHFNINKEEAIIKEFGVLEKNN